LVHQPVLCELVDARLKAACAWPDQHREQLIEAIRRRYGNGVSAILIYGSYLRGKRDTLLDFYVLLEDYAAMRSRWQAALAWALPPNVFQVQCGEPPMEARAKVAVMTLGRFEYVMSHDFHSYFWARFAQPSGLLYCREEAARTRVTGAITQAASTFVKAVVPLLPAEFTAAVLVGQGLSLTYRCELRSEPPGYATQLYGHDTAWYESLVALLAGAGLGYRASGRPGLYVNETGQPAHRRAILAWWSRRLQGKVLSVLRLFKAVLTFDRGFEYLLWKIGRHSGEWIELTTRQRKYPLLFGWPVLWRLYRRGAFR